MRWQWRAILIGFSFFVITSLVADKFMLTEIGTPKTYYGSPWSFLVVNGCPLLPPEKLSSCEPSIKEGVNYFLVFIDLLFWILLSAFIFGLMKIYKVKFGGKNN